MDQPLLIYIHGFQHTRNCVDRIAKQSKTYFEDIENLLTNTFPVHVGAYNYLFCQNIQVITNDTEKVFLINFFKQNCH